MIVVDTNVIVYCWSRGERRAVAQRLRLRDPEWHAPFFWRSEFRNVLCGYLRRGLLSVDAIQEMRAWAEGALAGREHVVSGAMVLDVAVETGLTAYDAEFVALAQALAVPLVTEDREVLEAFSGAMSMETFLAVDDKGPPAVHSRRGRYRIPTSSPVRLPSQTRPRRA